MDEKIKEIKDYVFWYRREIDQKLSPTLAGRIYLDHIEYLLTRIKELEEGIGWHRKNMWGYVEDAEGIVIWQVNNVKDKELYKLIEK